MVLIKVVTNWYEPCDHFQAPPHQKTTKVATTWHGHADTQNSDTTRHDTELIGTIDIDTPWHAIFGTWHAKNLGPNSWKHFAPVCPLAEDMSKNLGPNGAKHSPPSFLLEQPFGHKYRFLKFAWHLSLHELKIFCVVKWCSGSGRHRFRMSFKLQDYSVQSWS